MAIVKPDMGVFILNAEAFRFPKVSLDALGLLAHLTSIAEFHPNGVDFCHVADFFGVELEYVEKLHGELVGAGLM